MDARRSGDSMRNLAILLWILAGALYAAMLAWSLPHLSQAAGGLAMFDMRPSGYSTAEAEAIVSALDAEARLFYMDVQQRLDTAFPLVQGLALACSFSLLLPRVPALVLGLVALAGAVFDLFENAAVAALLRADSPTLDPLLVATANQWTLLKSGAATLALSAFLVAGLVALWRRLKRA